MDPKQRSNVRPGQRVLVVQKQDQRIGVTTEGVIEKILTNSTYHPHGIKVRLQTGEVGRVYEIIE